MGAQGQSPLNTLSSIAIVTANRACRAGIFACERLRTGLKQQDKEVFADELFQGAAAPTISSGTTFTAALADTAENTDTSPMADHVVDHFGEEHGLAHPGATKQAGPATALQWHEYIDCFDAGLEDSGWVGRSDNGGGARWMLRIAQLRYRKGIEAGQGSP